MAGVMTYLDTPYSDMVRQIMLEIIYNLVAIFCGCDFIEPVIEVIQSGTNGPCSSECVH